MGFDLSGLKAVSKKGEYFRNNVWWWRPLAYYVVTTCSVTNSDEWFWNNGYEVKEKEAEAIANELTAQLKNGAVAKYSRAYAKQLKELAEVECEHCKGTGKRDDKYVKGKCNGCSGKGKVRPSACNYPFSTQNVRKFRDFVKDSGGFAIY